MYIYWYKKKNPQVMEEEGTIPWPPFYLLVVNLDEPGYSFVITWSWLYFQCVNLFEEPAFQSSERIMENSGQSYLLPPPKVPLEKAESILQAVRESCVLEVLFRSSLGEKSACCMYKDGSCQDDL